jgi:tetratricopeptide (TPR) repeat protein
MMPQVPFIGRETELAHIDRAIGEWGTRRIICIHAEGGIGKTRLLQEVRKRYIQSENNEHLIITDIIDFDDYTYHISQNVGRRIAQMTDEAVFEPYLRGLVDYRRMEESNISRERLTDEGKRINQVFVECFNKMTEQGRVVLLLDTTDKLEGTEVWDYMVRLGLYLHNVVVLVAGRNAESLWKQLYSQLNADVQLIRLPAFTSEASASYLQAKLESRYISLNPELAQKVILLAKGRPILIDLAVEWLARDIPPTWLMECDLEKLKSLSDDQRKGLQKEFERHLMHPIAEMRKPIERLLLTMARVYPLDVEGIVAMLSVSTEEAESLFEEVQGYVFVKSLPDGRISLHDEMRRMVNEYVWPDIDPDGDRQRRDSNRAIEYLDNKVHILHERIEQLRQQEKEAQRKKDGAEAYTAFVQREALEREMWVLEEQQLTHRLLVNVAQGIHTFITLFDKTTQEYRFSYREVLLTAVQACAKEFTPSQYYEVNRRKIEYLIDEGELEQAKALAAELRNRENLLPEQRIRVLLQSGDVEIRLRNFEEAVNFYEEAARICREHGFEKQLVRAEKGMGYGYRLMGYHDQAQIHYLQALKLALQSGDREQQALISNNIAFLHTLRPVTQDKALQMSDRAIEIWRELGYKRGLGIAYNTRACILYRFGRYDEALRYFELAISIFQPQNDWEWLSVVYSWRGVTYWAMARFYEPVQAQAPSLLDKARIDLETASDHLVPRDAPMTLNRLARVYRDLRQDEKAHKFAKESYDLALKARDRQYEVVALDTLARLALDWDTYGTLEEFEEKVKLYEQRYPKDQQDSVTLGRVYSHMAGLTLERNDPEKAIQYYERGFVLVALYSGYGWISLSDLLKRLERSIFVTSHHNVVDAKFIRRLGEILNNTWARENLDETAPEVLPIFARWQNWPEQS